MQAIKDKINQLLTMLSRLGPREQAMVALGSVGAVAVLVAIISISIGASISQSEKKIKELRVGLSDILAVERTYRKAVERKERFVETLKDNKVDLSTAVGKIAAEMGLEIDSITNTSGSLGAKSSFREDAIKVQMRKVGFVDLFDLFNRVDSMSELIYIKEVSMKRRYDDPQSTDLTFVVATVKLKDA